MLSVVQTEPELDRTVVSPQFESPANRPGATPGPTRLGAAPWLPRSLVRAVTQEETVDDLVDFAGLVQTAGACRRLGAIALDHPPHLLHPPTGMEALAEFECDGGGGGRHGHAVANALPL